MRALGVFCSDLHLTSKVPGCRGDDWLEAQERMLRYITTLSKRKECPVFVSGDIFHRPKEDPSVVSLAIRYMKQCKWYGIPGQHDLPGHNLQRIEESSFWNLVEADVLEYAEGLVEKENYYLIGHPFGVDPIDASELIEKNDKKVIGLSHRLVWQQSPYPGAPETGNVKQVLKQYKGYHVLVFGDNHQGFMSKHRKGKGDVLVLNCGVAIRRTRAEIDYVPRCYLLYEDMSVKQIALPYKTDVILEEDARAQGNERLHAFVETLMKQTEISLSFTHNLKQFLEQNETRPEVEEILWAIMEQTNE